MTGETPLFHPTDTSGEIRDALEAAANEAWTRGDRAIAAAFAQAAGSYAIAVAVLQISTDLNELAEAEASKDDRP